MKPLDNDSALPVADVKALNEAEVNSLAEQDDDWAREPPRAHVPRIWCYDEPDR